MIIREHTQLYYPICWSMTMYNPISHSCTITIHWICIVTLFDILRLSQDDGYLLGMMPLESSGNFVVNHAAALRCTIGWTSRCSMASYQDIHLISCWAKLAAVDGKKMQRKAWCFRVRTMVNHEFLIFHLFPPFFHEPELAIFSSHETFRGLTGLTYGAQHRNWNCRFVDP